jgi:pilus assembly protein TadC
MTEVYTLLARLLPFTILSGALYLFIEIPLFCVALELLICRFMSNPYAITWSAVVLTVCVIIDIALITILAKKRLRNEVRRRLHF